MDRKNDQRLDWYLLSAQTDSILEAGLSLIADCGGAWQRDGVNSLRIWQGSATWRIGHPIRHSPVPGGPWKSTGE
ncbi:hypothetical protein SAE02_73110 [Skermanella aerolata]|uniref:Uncharacterized protein n=1 Tax=Skermanella aerolata TaxID=393310 RepID=A0A512E358_9PROT|nr:hypothetical protein SAE02_73110 [Skermanella aerolata]